MDNSKNTFSELVKAAYREPVVDKEFEHRVMLEVARHAIFRSRQRSQRGTVALLSGISVAAAACVAAVVAFQRNFGLTSDGVIGPATWRKIVEVANQAGKTIDSGRVFIFESFLYTFLCYTIIQTIATHDTYPQI